MWKIYLIDMIKKIKKITSKTGFDFLLISKQMRIQDREKIILFVQNSNLEHKAFFWIQHSHITLFSLSNRLGL